MLMLSLLGCSVDTSPTLTPAPALSLSEDQQLVVTWVADGDLWIWDSKVQTPERILFGEAIRPVLSPSGERIAFTIGENGLERSIFRINRTAEGVQPLPRDFPLINQIVWRDESTMLFNTLEQTDLGVRPREDLYQVNSDMVVMQRDTGGHFSLSPDKTQMILVTAGVYGGEAARIRWLDLSTDTLTDLLDFPSVATGSHFPFYPPLHWQDNTTALVAIPDADAIYQETSVESVPVALWELTAMGETTKRGDIPASFFGLPVPAPSGDKLVYFRRSETDPNGFALYTSALDGSSTVQYAIVDNLVPVQWLPDGERFVYANDNAYWVGTIENEPQRWVELPSEVITAPMIVGNGIVYITFNDGQNELRYAPIGDSPSGSILINTFAQESPVFDSVIIGTE